MGRYRWVVALFVLALLALVGIYAYQAGVAHGLARSGALAAAGAAAPPVYWYWRPWGFGFFPFFPIVPILFILFWVIVLRALFWRGRFPGYWQGRGYNQGVPPMFDEWHRRAHADAQSASSESKV